MRWALIPLLVMLLSGCRKDPAPAMPGNEMFALQVPPGFPAPPLREDNPLTVASVQLGRALFFEKGLSRDNTISCGSCHIPQYAFSDTVAFSLGVEGRTGERNGPALFNLAYHNGFFRDGGVRDLELQVLAPVHEPLEMDHDITLAATTLGGREPYRSLSQQAYGRELDGYVITRAIANYERTLLSGWSRYDRFMQGDTDALTPSEQQGLDLFQSSTVGCASCHTGHDLSDHDYYNVGQYSSYADPGRYRITLVEADRGKFKVPSLRNISLTGPYMHDGSMQTLEEVVDHFLSGGMPHPNRSPLLQVVNLSAQERADLVAFLLALEDEGPIDRTQ